MRQRQRCPFDHARCAAGTEFFPTTISTVSRTGANDPPRMSSHPASNPPWQAGWQAARANLIPGLIVQTVMIGLGLAYYFLPESRPGFDQLGALKQRWGFFYSGLSAAIAGGVLPEILRVVVFQKGRVERRNFANLLFNLPFWGVQGILVDVFYRGQALWFGQDATFAVIAKKVLVDQFLYNPLFAAPFGVSLYEWKNNGFRWTNSLGLRDYYRQRIFPALMATWAVWIPLVSVIYALPSPLQIPIFGLGLTFWVMMFTWISETAAGERT